MARFIFYTCEGRTQAPDGSEVENCQMLGIANGDNRQEAKTRLLVENDWILECGYRTDRIICEELASASHSSIASEIYR